MLRRSPRPPCPGLALLGDRCKSAGAVEGCTSLLSELSSAGIAGNRGREMEDLLLGKSSHFPPPSGDICDNHGECYHFSLQ